MKSVNPDFLVFTVFIRQNVVSCDSVISSDDMSGHIKRHKHQNLILTNLPNTIKYKKFLLEFRVIKG